MKNTKAIFSGLVVSCIIATGAFAGDKATFTSESDVMFEDIIPETVAFATVAGDRAAGSHGTFVRIPAGKETPLHTHGATYHAVVVAGILENPIVGNDDSTRQLPAGSYYSVPTGAPHITRCAASSPTQCVTYFHQDTSFDFAVVE